MHDNYFLSIWRNFLTDPVDPEGENASFETQWIELHLLPLLHQGVNLGSVTMWLHSELCLHHFGMARISRIDWSHPFCLGHVLAQ